MNSIVLVLCSLIDTLPLPTRSEKRSFPLLIRWFELNWAQIEPFLLLVQLRDATLEEINFPRQKADWVPPSGCSNVVRAKAQLRPYLKSSSSHTSFSN
jgi:hypothetical protein